MKKAIVLLSGGLDSATTGIIARDMGFNIYALSFAYGQRNAFELNAARNVAQTLGVKEHRIINIDLASFGGSALTDSNIDIPKDCVSKNGIPVTYVPARNTIFLSYALAWAEVLEGGCTDIFIGVNNIDYSGYPDCRPEYIEAFRIMANLATASAINGHKITIHTPLMSQSKAEIIKIGMNAGFDYGITVSCYDPHHENGSACGRCDSCLIRKKGFYDAGAVDSAIGENKILEFC